MTDRRRKIEALRAKADSTTFPAEAAALRAKADELAAQEPKRPPIYDGLSARQGEAAARFYDGIFNSQPTAANNVTIRFHGNFFEQMGGILFTPPPWATVADDAAANRVRVTDVNGRTYWITVE